MQPNFKLLAFFQGIRRLFFFLFLLMCFDSLGQNSFIKTIEEKYVGRSISIKGLADNGFIIFCADSQKVYRFTACGALVWAKQFNVERTATLNTIQEVIYTKTGSLLFLFRKKVGSRFFPALVMMDGNGNVQFSKTYEDPIYMHFPYTVTEDLKGNFLVFGTATDVGRFYLRAMKVNAEGNEIWTNFYNHGWVWGGCIATSDTGFLFRNGRFTVKLNSRGIVEWSKKFIIAFYYFYPPVEVEDGYIFSGTISSALGKQVFTKIDKQGNGLLGNRHIFDFYGSPSPMVKMPNGNWLVAFNPNVGPMENPILVEFDKDIQVVNSRVIKVDGLNKKLRLKNYEVAADGSILFTGSVQEVLLALAPTGVFYGRTSSTFELTCSDTFPITDSVRSSLMDNEPFETIPYYTNITNFDPGLKTIQSKYKTICGPLPMKTDLGKDTVICNSSSLGLKNLKSGDADAYLWSTGQSSKEITVQNPGTYWLKTWNSCRQDTTKDTIQILKIAIAPLMTDLGKDTAICQNASILLKNRKNNDADSLLWSSGQSSKEIKVEKPGKYWLKIWNTCTKDSANDTIQISNIKIPEIELTNQKELCDGKQIMLEAKVSDANFLWPDGSKDSTFWVMAPGSYQVSITKKTCLFTAKTEITECEQLEMPNLFTPNADQINERVKPIFYQGISSSEMKLYNRWGQLIHTTNDILNNGWDGSGHNSGVYFWTLRYKTTNQIEKMQNGVLTLERN